MNLSPRWINTLAQAGFEAVHWSTLGAANASDATILAFARDHGYVVLTHDLDFGAILAATQCDAPSVVQIRSEHLSPQSISGSLVNAVQQTTVQLEDGGLLTVDPARARFRPLPAGRK